jgi:sialate O-acetylesterase
VKKISVGQRVGFALCLAFGLVASGYAEIRLPKVIGDHAVLQRDRPIRIWGWASPAALLTVSFHDQHVTTIADRIGQWTAWLMPEAAGGPYTLTVLGDGKEGRATITDVLVGDVWVASGQSNMEMPLQGFDADTTVKDGPAEIKAADHPQIRLLHVNHASSDFPLADIADHWTLCNADTVANFSAIAYFFGREVSAKEHVPIGLIDAAWGGVPIDSFLSLEALSANSAMLPALVNRAHFAHRLTNRAAILELRQQEDDADKAAGKPVHKHDWIPEGGAWLPAGPYNGMIAPLTQFSIRGFLWYQGETDTDSDRAPSYLDLFKALIFDWRNQFAQGDLPFLFVQLTSFNGGTNWGVVRDAQRRALSLRDTAMAVTLDVGKTDNIHPPDKQSVAARLALAARHMAYDERVAYLSPLFRQATTERGAMRVWLDNAEKLHTREGKLMGFELAGEDRHFVAADATIDGSTVVVRSSQVPDPRYVRYAWDGIAPPSLYNQAELPASTFTSE